jgi:hypothetical protein
MGLGHDQDYLAGNALENGEQGHVISAYPDMA